MVVVFLIHVHFDTATVTSSSCGCTCKGRGGVHPRVLRVLLHELLHVHHDLRHGLHGGRNPAGPSRLRNPTSET